MLKCETANRVNVLFFMFVALTMKSRPPAKKVYFSASLIFLMDVFVVVGNWPRKIKQPWAKCVISISTLEMNDNTQIFDVITKCNKTHKWLEAVQKCRWKTTNSKYFKETFTSHEFGNVMWMINRVAFFWESSILCI